VNGLNSTTCSSAVNCGTATAVGRCCGGARITFADWSGYMFCGPSGTDCAPAGTGTVTN
jgi:hypothetical protein